MLSSPKQYTSVCMSVRLSLYIFVSVYIHIYVYVTNGDLTGNTEGGEGEVGQ